MGERMRSAVRGVVSDNALSLVLAMAAGILLGQNQKDEALIVLAALVIGRAALLKILGNSLDSRQK